MPEFTEEVLQERTAEIRRRISKEHPRANPYEVESMAANSVRFASPLLPIFLLGMMRLQWEDDPLIFKVDHEGDKNEWAYRQISRLCQTKFPCFMGSGSSGKSYLAAAYCYTMWKKKPWATSVFFSTTSGEAAEQRGWGYMKSFYRADKYQFGTLLEYKKSIVLEDIAENDKTDRDFRNSIHLVLIKPGNEGDNALSAISGRKNETVIWLKDESQLMTNDTTIAEANLCSNEFCQIIDIGNAPREGTQFYETAMPFGENFEAGYRSINIDTDTGWPTKSGWCEWFDGERSPNLRYKEPPFKGIITRDSIVEMEKRCGGRDTPGFWIQVKGFPHSADIRDTVLTKDLLRANQADQRAVWSGSGAAPKTIGGGDLGFRKDGDPCVACFGRIGVCEDNVTRLDAEPHSIIIAPSSTSSLPFEDQIALRFIQVCDERQCKEFQLDITGDGGIILSRCIFHSQGRINFIPKSFGGVPDETPIGNGDERTCREVYDREVTKLWYGVRMSVQAGVVRGMSLQSRIVEQFCARKVVHQDKEKKISIETKTEMKKRIKRSPDDADAYANLHDLARKHGLAASLNIKPIEDDVPDKPDEKIVPYDSGAFNAARYTESNRRAYSSR